MDWELAKRPVEPLREDRRSEQRVQPRRQRGCGNHSQGFRFVRRQPLSRRLGRSKARRVAAAVCEVEHDMEGVGRLIALGVKRVVVVGASIKMKGSLLGM